jgi:His/Glu/Gln/Arg/opine family amino acid ABC transporter permease subunit
MIDEFIDGFTKTFITGNRYMTFLKGFETTLYIAVFAVMIGIMLGICIAIVKVYHYRTGKMKILNIIAHIYTTVIRGVPVVVQLMILYFIIFTHFRNGANVAIIGFGINSGAYVSEIVRAGIMSIDKGQSEAGRSLGLSEATTMTNIILPQAIKNILPALFNEFITLLKETSVAGYIAVIDLTKAGDLVRARTMEPYFSLISIAVVYLILVVALTQVQRLIERKLQKSDRR